MVRVGVDASIDAAVLLTSSMRAAITGFPRNRRKTLQSLWSPRCSQEYATQWPHLKGVKSSMSRGPVWTRAEIVPPGVLCATPGVMTFQRANGTGSNLHEKFLPVHRNAASGRWTEDSRRNKLNASCL